MEKNNSEKITDITYLDSICEGDTDFKKDLIHTFLTNSPAMISEMKSLMQDSAWKKIGNIAHSLKPSFIMMGMKTERETALKIENYCREIMHTDEIGELIGYLEKRLETAYIELNEEITRL